MHGEEKTIYGILEDRDGCGIMANTFTNEEILKAGPWLFCNGARGSDDRVLEGKFHRQIMFSAILSKSNQTCPLCEQLETHQETIKKIKALGAKLDPSK